MLIKYIDPDPRAGREVRLADELAERLIESGRAEQVKEPKASDTPAPAPAPAKAAQPHRRK